MAQTVHTYSQFRFDVNKRVVKMTRANDNGGVEQEAEMTVVSIFDLESGEQHHLLFDEEGKRNLIRQLTGGIVLAEDT